MTQSYLVHAHVWFGQGVTHLRVFTCGMDRVTSKMFRCCTLRKSSALSDVQGLGIVFLDIPKFTSRPQQYLGHFSPAVQSPTLIESRGYRRQIIYFTELFQHLEDLKPTFRFPSLNFQDEAPVGDLTLIPSFALPPLRRRLTMTLSRRAGLLEDMIRLSGGILFRPMDLVSVDRTRLLLDTCVETPETLRLHQNDPRGE